MGRSKQSARKFDGATPMSQRAACTSSATFRHYMVSQQASGLESARGMRGSSSSQSEKIFVNSENTFSNFSFHRPTTAEDFLPVVQVGKVRNFSETDKDPSLFMRLDFLSRFDGRADMLSESRQGIDAVFVLDVSGSMSLAFPDDSDRRSKLEVAKDAIRNIFTKLSARDRVAFVTFNTTAKTILPLTTVSDECKGTFESSFEKIHANGGTNLSSGLAQGFHHLSSPTAQRSSLFKPAGTGSSKRLKRVFFLTDMESTVTDEVELVAIAQRNASNSCFFTVVGVGVDLSAATVERVSAVPGSRYMSVVNSREIDKVLVNDFEYDLEPIASDIRLTFPEACGISFKKCFGSSELSSRPSRHRMIRISSEFPMSLEAPETVLGGLYLFQLEVEQTIASPIPLEVSWKDREGNQRQLLLALGDLIHPLLPLSTLGTENDTVTTEHGLVLEINNASPYCDVGIRKACALIRYVETLTSYVTKNDAPAIPRGESAVIDSDAIPLLFQRNGPRRQARQFIPQATAAPIALAPPIVLHSPYTVNEMVLQHHHDQGGRLLNDIGAPNYVTSRLNTVHQFRILRAYLLSELAMCGDMSLMAEAGAEYCNRNILETIDQILSIEEKDLTEAISAWRSSLSPSNQLPTHRDAVAVADAVTITPSQEITGWRFTEGLQQIPLPPVPSIPLATSIPSPSISNK